MNIISIKSVIGGQFAIDPDNGEKLYDEMKKYLEKDQCFTLDFEGIEIFIASFACYCIGQMVYDFGKDTTQKIVDSVVNCKPQHKRCLDRVVRNYERYSAIPAERISAVVDKMFEDFANGTWRDGMHL
jgi:hypothetical protein